MMMSQVAMHYYKQYNILCTTILNKLIFLLMNCSSLLFHPALLSASANWQPYNIWWTTNQINNRLLVSAGWSLLAFVDDLLLVLVPASARCWCMLGGIILIIKLNKSVVKLYNSISLLASIICCCRWWYWLVLLFLFLLLVD